MPHKLANRFNLVEVRKKSKPYQLTHTLLRSKRPGFTLIELLVVIAILGVLSSFVTFSLIGHQRKARDAQRKSDLTQVKKAMEAAKNDCRASAYYPSNAAIGGESGRFNNLTGHLKNTNLKYISTDIKDPKNDTTYFYGATFKTSAGNFCANEANPPAKDSYAATEYFVLRAKLESPNDPDRTNSYNQCSNIVTTAIGIANFDSTDPQTAPSSSDSYYYVCNN